MRGGATSAAPSLPLLIVLALLSAACGSAPGRSPVEGAPPPGARGTPPRTLVLDLGSRAGHDLQALTGEGGRYELAAEGEGLSGRFRVLQPRSGGPPAEIRLVSSGRLSRLALLEAGRLDGAELVEKEAAEHAAAPDATQVHVFPDFERIVLRLGPRLGAAERDALWRSVDRGGLADVLFPVTGRAASGCLPGRDEPEPNPLGGELPEGSLTLLLQQGGEVPERVALRVAAAWNAAGARARVERVPFAVLRDRLVTGRFDAALLMLSRSGGAPLEGWVCSRRRPPGGGLPGTWLREVCGLYPLVSLDRVTALRAGLGGLEYDPEGRVLWDRVIVSGAS